MEKPLNRIKGIIWDLDDTLYRRTSALTESMCHSIAKFVTEQGCPISYEDALSIAQKTHINENRIVKRLVEQFDIQAQDLHFPFHDALDHTTIEPCPKLPTAFAKLVGVEHALTTHASKEWALRVLNHVNIAPFFETDTIFGIEDLDFEYKFESDRAVNTCLDALDLDNAKVAFVEDTVKNLVIPYQMGLTTILINHPSQPRELPSHVHYRFDSAADFLNELSRGQLQKTA